VRRVVEHQYRTNESDFLQVVTVFEEGLSKEDIKKENIYSKNHQVLIKRNDIYDFKDKRA
jgi:hypothetical protein